MVSSSAELCRDWVADGVGDEVASFPASETTAVDAVLDGGAGADDRATVDRVMVLLLLLLDEALSAVSTSSFYLMRNVFIMTEKRT